MGLATDVQDCRLLCVMSQKLSPNWELVFLLEWECIVLNYKVFSASQSQLLLFQSVSKQ